MMSYEEMQWLLMRELHLYHYPIAVRFFFAAAELEAFKRESDEIESPLKPLTFCQWEVAARMQGKVIYGERRDLSCHSARYCFGWKEFDETEVAGQMKYAGSRELAERFVRSKPRLPEGLLGVAVAPLAKAGLFDHADTVHFYCDPMQAYSLAVDYMAAVGVHPLPTSIMTNSSACGGNAGTYLSGQFNLLLACSGSYAAGKTERNEVNIILPGERIGALCQRLMERVDATGGGSLARTGDGFPGADICQNCPLIAFRRLDA